MSIEEKELKELAQAMYNVHYSLCCDYCTMEKCREAANTKSCIDCIADYFRIQLARKKVKSDMKNDNLFPRQTSIDDFLE